MKSLPASVCIALITAVSLVAYGEAAGPNLLANPSFEEPLAENGAPSGWTVYGGLDELRHITVVEGGTDGIKAVRLEDNHDRAEVGLRQEVAVEGGTPYVARVSVGAVADASPGGSYLQLRFAPSNKFVQRPLIPGLGDAMATIEVGKVAPPGSKSATIYLYTHAGPTPSVLLDNVHLRAVDALPDQLRAPGVAEVPEIEQLKPLHLETALVADGKAAAIVVPEGGRYAIAAKTIADAIAARSGVRPLVVSDTGFGPELAIDANLIVLGNRSTNSLLATLYERYYTLLDLKYPGPRGYVVRTLHNPTGSGRNVVLVGGSDDDGVLKAAQSLAETIGNRPVADETLAIGRLMDIELGKGVTVPADLREFETWEASRGYGSVGYFGWNSISKRMAMYYMTGDEFHAREAIRLAFPDEQAKQEIADIDGERIENKDAPLSGPYHYNAHMMILFWDLIEESPVFTDAERLRVTRAFAQQLNHHGIQRAYVGPYAATPAAVGSRHGQWTAISLYCLGRYFARDYDDLVWPVCESNGASHFKSLHEHAWVRGESDNLFWYNTGTAPILTYMLLSGDRVPRENGVLGQLLRAQEALISGRPGDWALRYGSIGYYHKAAYLTGEDRWLEYARRTGLVDYQQQILRRMGEGSEALRLGQSYWPTPGRKPEQPKDLAGKWTVNPLPEPMWKGGDSGLAHDESFQFASYRTAADETGDFILLDGLNGASRNPYHTFALLELRQDGETILEGYLNQLRTRADGLTEPEVAMDAALKKVEVLGDVAIAVAEVPNMPYASWKRTIVSRKGEYTLIADAVTPRVDTDNFEIQLLWETKASNWKVDRPSRILATKAEDPAKTATVAASLPMETKVDGMTATMTWVGPVNAGERLHILSVVSRGTAQGPGRVDAAVVDGKSMALGLPEPAMATAGTQTDGSVEVVTESHYTGLDVVGGSGLFSSSAPLNVAWDFAKASLIVESPGAATLDLRFAPSGSPSHNGESLVALGAEGRVSVVLDKGVHRFSGVTPTNAFFAAETRDLPSLVEGLGARDIEGRRPAPEPANPTPLEPTATYNTGEPVVDLIEIPHDDGPRIAAAAGTTIHVITPDGEPLMTFPTDGPIRMLRWWAEHNLLLAGCADEKVIAFNAAGERQWTFVSEMDPAVYRAAKTYWFKSAPGHEGIHGLHTGVFLDGKSQAFVGSACTLEIIDEHGQLIKRMPQFWGKVSLFKIIPTGDDSLTLLAGRKYNGTNTLGVIDNKSLDPDPRGFYGVPEGHTHIGGWSSMNRHHLFFEDFDGDGEKEVMSEINGSWNRVTVWDKDGIAKYDASFGPGDRIPAKNIRDIDTADLDGDGLPEIVVAEKTGLLVALEGTCERKWGTNLGGPPVVMNCVTPAESGAPMIFAALEDGTVKVLDAHGDLLRQGKVDGKPICLLKSTDGMWALGMDSGQVSVFGR